MVNKGRPFVARSRECLLDVTLCPGVPIMDGQERSAIRYSALNVDGGFTSALGTGVLQVLGHAQRKESRVAFGI